MKEDGGDQHCGSNGIFYQPFYILYLASSPKKPLEVGTIISLIYRAGPGSRGHDRLQLGLVPRRGS